MSKELKEQLANDGWKCQSNRNRDIQIYEEEYLLYKSFPNHEECNCNKGKNKQVGIKICRYRPFYMDKTPVEKTWSVHLDLHGELVNEEWIHISIENISNPTMEKVLGLVEDMLNTWDFAAKQCKAKSKTTL